MRQRKTDEELRDEALKHFVHTPAESASGYVKFAKETAADKGVTWGVTSLDTNIIPIRKGRVMCLLARSGHGKTSVGAYLVKRTAMQIAKAGEQDKFYTAHITWEQPAEEIEALYAPLDGYTVTDVAWGRVPIGEVIRSSARRQHLPVWIFGDSIYKTDIDTPPMTLEYVLNAVHGIKEKWDMWPKLLFFDYIQDIPVPDERDRISQVTAAIRTVKRLGYQLKTSVLLGVQANRRSDDRANPIPQSRDTEWSNEIEKKTDGMVALWKPIKSYHPQEKAYINVAGKDYHNVDNLLVVKNLKQRGDSSSGIWAMDFDPATLTLKDWR